MSGLKSLIKEIPFIGQLVRRVYRRRRNPPNRFTDSRQYWIDRYATGGNSGDGSYGKLSKFKAEFLNEFVRRNHIKSIIEFGCGDGNQLKLAEYPDYIGFDVSADAIANCRMSTFGEGAKRFSLLQDYTAEKALLALSLDVIFHLVEEDVFADYMERLFEAAGEFVIIYSSNFDQEPETGSAHVRHRKFSDWIETHKPHWHLCKHIPNRYPYAGDNQAGSLSDFHVYAKDPEITPRC